jgi:uncharacterized membrane protein
MAAYAAAAIWLVAVTVSQWDAPTFIYVAGFGLAIVLVLLGSFHAAGYSRSTEAFFAYGCLGGLMLGPIYIALGRHFPFGIQIILSIACFVALGALARTCAVLRWRLQDRTASPRINRSVSDNSGTPIAAAQTARCPETGPTTIPNTTAPAAFRDQLTRSAGTIAARSGNSPG